jgi:sugar O-acyltransferase (sialic acid O-acetyltransferase NeuD family)
MVSKAVIFAVGSPLVVDLEESLHRAGIEVRVAIHNIDGPHYFSGDAPVLAASGLPRAITATPFMAPLFTPAHRQSAVLQARALGFGRALTLVDPTTPAPRSLTLGEGCWINSACSLGAASAFGDFVLINRGSSIGHHCQFEDFVSIGPGVTIAGQVRIGKGAVVGAGATVLPTVKIGANAVVGAGAVVTADVPDQGMVLGSPAKLVKQGIGGYRGLAVQ